MKIATGIIGLLLSASFCSAELRVQTALKSGITPTQTRVYASSFTEPGSTNLNYYPINQGTSVQWMCGGLEVAAVNANGQLVNAEFRITAGSFTLYRNGTQFVKTNMNIFLPPNGGGTPSISVYDKAGARNASHDYQTIIGSITGARLVLAEHIFVIGATPPKFPQLDNVAGSSYVLGYTLTGDYRPEGATEFIPFNLLPGDHGFPTVNNTYRNYVAIVIGGSTQADWILQLTQTTQKTLTGRRYVISHPSDTTFPGGNTVVGVQTSTNLLDWVPTSFTNLNPSTWVTSDFGNGNRFFRATVATKSLFP